MGMRLPIATVLAFVLLSSPANANVCMDKWREGRAVHAELQRQAIEELNRKDYKAACKTMQELAGVSETIRRFLQLNCRNNEAMKRGLARTDDIAARAQEICAQAER
jgi:hypothetical protein